MTGGQIGREKVFFSCVIKRVPISTPIEHIEAALKEEEIDFTLVKRIKSRATQRETTLIRVLAAKVQSIDKLLTEGVYIYGRYHEAEQSNPLPPRPAQCGKCLQFDHPATQCKGPTTCGRCSGNHQTQKCNEKEMLCFNCKGKHHAFSFQCPSRPAEALNDKTAVKLQCHDKPVPINGVHKDKTIANIVTIDNLLRSLTTILCNLLPTKRDLIQGAVNSAANILKKTVG